MLSALGNRLADIEPLVPRIREAPVTVGLPFPSPGGKVEGHLEVEMKLRVVLEPSNDGGYTVLVPALPGCVSEGDTREEALRNIQEAIQVYLEPVDDDSQAKPNAEVVEIAV